MKNAEPLQNTGLPAEEAASDAYVRAHWARVPWLPPWTALPGLPERHRGARDCESKGTRTYPPRHSGPCTDRRPLASAQTRPACFCCQQRSTRVGDAAPGSVAFGSGGRWRSVRGYASVPVQALRASLGASRLDTQVTT